MSQTVTKADLARAIQQRVGLSRRESKERIEEVLDLIIEALEEGEKVKLPGFGNFVVRDKAARMGRNPQTGEAMVIARRRVLRFKLSPRLRSRMNPQRNG